MGLAKIPPDYILQNTELHTMKIFHSNSIPSCFFLFFFYFFLQIF
uniref:Uncharacterized protein n=1 Tax=Rhizophora mucronata TaxID=61149 RepID=A0A2P2L9M6_RHIMU